MLDRLKLGVGTLRHRLGRGLRRVVLGSSRSPSSVRSEGGFVRSQADIGSDRMRTALATLHPGASYRAAYRGYIVYEASREVTATTWRRDSPPKMAHSCKRAW